MEEKKSSHDIAISLKHLTFFKAPFVQILFVDAISDLKKDKLSEAVNFSRPLASHRRTTLSFLSTHTVTRARVHTHR